MLGTRIGRALLTAAAIVVVVVMAITVFVLVSRGDTDTSSGEQAAETGPAQVVRENSHRLNAAPGAAVTLVEFLDFECEGCRAAYPVVEQLRADYGDRVEFVLRYFPLSGHVNGERAARAVEAAAEQGKLEAMYHKMYETQSEWGERSTPADDVFRGFAVELGLDILSFEKAYNDPATLQRIRLDLSDGRALGVRGTPTFFVNGEQVQLESFDDLRNAVESALR